MDDFGEMGDGCGTRMHQEALLRSTSAREERSGSSDPRGARRWLGLALIIAVLDCAYLAQRLVRLRLGLADPGTGVCSWTATIDCDVVLLSPEARAFYVPNATLGLGYFLAAAFFWFVGERVDPESRRARLVLLTSSLALATLFTLRFYSLLVRLPALCPFCPWNHTFTWVALASAIVLLRRTTGPFILRRRTVFLAVAAIGVFAVVQLAWLAGVASGLPTGPTIFAIGG